MEKTVIYQAEGSIGRVIFNRPDAMNGLNGEMPSDLCHAFDEARDDDESRVIIFEGRGACFMAGGDLNYFKQLVDNKENNNGDVVSLDFFKHVHGAVERMRKLPKPIIAKVHGAVAGIGLSYMLGADLIIAEEKTIFTMAYNNIGITPDGGSTWLLSRRIGFGRAMEMALLNEKINAKHAQTIGLINCTAPRSELDETTLNIAQKLAKGPQSTQAQTKHLLNKGLENSLDQQLDLEAHAFSNASQKAEFEEGVNAFIERRNANFDF